MSKQIIAAIIVTTVILLVGCAGPDRIATDYGTSYNLAKFNQTLNPDASNNLAPVRGLDGNAAIRVMDGYVQGMGRTRQAPAPYIVNVGNGSR